MSQKIFVVTHKVLPVLQDDIYQPILVGDYNDAIPEGWLRDNVGDNISHLNSMWNEMTAIYRVWKNYSDFEYIGFCHYRRYFSFTPWWKNISEINFYDLLRSYKTTFQQLSQQPINPDKRLKRCDAIILRSITYLRTTLHETYSADALSYDMKLMVSTMISKHPDLKEAVHKYFFKLPGRLYTGNMFIMKREDFIDYCNFIFPILFQLSESILDPKGEKVKRTIGYLSERLTSFYLHTLLENRKIKFAKSIMITDFM